LGRLKEGDVVLGRRKKVFAAALISIAAMSMVLELLGGKPPKAGAFSLSEYHGLAPVADIVRPYITVLPRRWNFIEINYSGTIIVDVNEVPPRGSLFNLDYPSYHFIICSGNIGSDGQILISEKWRKQNANLSTRMSDKSDNTIRICVMLDKKMTHPTDFQITRTEALVEELSNGFGIDAAGINYPENWRQR
jgi:hypothetical protein